MARGWGQTAGDQGKGGVQRHVLMGSWALTYHIHMGPYSQSFQLVVGRHNPNAFPLAAVPQTPAFFRGQRAVPGLGGCPLNFPRGCVIMVPWDKRLQLLSNLHTRIQLTLITITGGADQARAVTSKPSAGCPPAGGPP